MQTKDAKFIDRALVAELHDQASRSTRLCTHYNLYASHDEPIQRMCMAMEPGDTPPVFP